MMNWKTFNDKFDFSRAGDLDTQQSILRDIVEGIYRADVIIADLTGLNPNVFYELGLAHAMNKKVIIITQNLSELPFDIESYYANEYGMKFNEVPIFVENLRKLLYGTIDGSIKYGNPVSDFIPNFHEYERISTDHGEFDSNIEETSLGIDTEKENGEKEFLNLKKVIQTNFKQMTNELDAMIDEMVKINSFYDVFSDNMKHLNNTIAGAANLTFTNKFLIRDACLNLSDSLDISSEKLNDLISRVSNYWKILENDLLSFFDNPYAKKEDNLKEIRDLIHELIEVQSEVKRSFNLYEFICISMRDRMGLERRLDRAISKLAYELSKLYSTNEKIVSSTARMISKGQVLLNLTTQDE